MRKIAALPRQRAAQSKLQLKTQRSVYLVLGVELDVLVRVAITPLESSTGRVNQMRSRDSPIRVINHHPPC